jgi:hypothetical protein
VRESTKTASGALIKPAKYGEEIYERFAYRKAASVAMKDFVALSMSDPGFQSRFFCADEAAPLEKQKYAHVRSWAGLIAFVTEIHETATSPAMLDKLAVGIQFLHRITTDVECQLREFCVTAGSEKHPIKIQKIGKYMVPLRAPNAEDSRPSRARVVTKSVSTFCYLAKAHNGPDIIKFPQVMFDMKAVLYHSSPAATSSPEPTATWQYDVKGPTKCDLRVVVEQADITQLPAEKVLPNAHLHIAISQIARPCDV